MNPIQLFHQNGKATGIYYCEKCRIVHRELSMAEKCCAPVTCSSCGSTDVSKYHTKCDACENKERAQREADRFEKAEKLTVWDGPVYSDGHGYHEGYFATIDDFEDWLATDENFDGTELERPEYVWACTSAPFCVLDIDRIIEDAAQEAFDDWDGDTAGYDELKKSIEVFNEANKHLIAWTPNYKAAVLLASLRTNPVSTDDATGAATATPEGAQGHTSEPSSP